MYGISNSQQQGGGGGVSSELVTTLKGTEIIKTFDNLDGCELTKGFTADGSIADMQNTQIKGDTKWQL
mgnify:CR=1 FL=1